MTHRLGSAAHPIIVIVIVVVACACLAARAAGADPLAPSPGKVRWGNELPPIGELMAMSAPDLEAALKDAVAMDVTVSRRTALQALILRVLATKQASAAAVLDVFPLTIEVTGVDGRAGDPKVNAAAAARLQEMSIVAFEDVSLPARAATADAPGGARLRVSVAVIENDKRGLNMGSMRSFGVQVAASLVGADGRERVSFGIVRSALGVDEGAAIARDFDRNAAAGVVPEVIELLARQVLRSADLPVPPMKRQGLTVREATPGPVASLEGLSTTELRTALAATLRPRPGASFQTREALSLLSALARTDDQARQALAMFPAELVVEGPQLSPMIIAAFDGQLKRVAQEAGLPIVARSDAPAGARIRVTLQQTETKSGFSVGMQAFTTTAIGTLRAPNGTTLSFSCVSSAMGINAGFAANDGGWGSKLGAQTFDELARAVVGYGAGVALVDDLPALTLTAARDAVTKLDAALSAGRGLAGFAPPGGARPPLRVSVVIETGKGISPLLSESLAPTVERALAAAGFALAEGDGGASVALSAIASEPRSMYLDRSSDGMKVVDVVGGWSVRPPDGPPVVVGRAKCSAISVGRADEIVVREKGKVAACLAKALAEGLTAALR